MTQNLKERTEAVLREFKGDTYAFGSGARDEAAGTLRAIWSNEAAVPRQGGAAVLQCCSAAVM